MAEFLWTFAVQEILKKVLKVAAEEIGAAWGLHKELSKLRKWLLKAEAILIDINTKKLHHESVRMWVQDLQHIVYEADDLLDELVYEDIRQKVETEETKKVHSFFSSSISPFLFRLKMAKRMKDITNTLHKHYCEASPLGLVGLVGGESIETYKNIDLKQIRETTSNLNFEEVIIGREVEVSNIVKLVIESSNEHPLSIIPIVGMGGLGKTTLAKMVFNHELVKGHFNETIWVCVAESFSIINILEGMFQSLTKTSSGLNKENLLQRLQVEMWDKNYFLVLDDVWNEEARLWSELRECLKNIAGKSGSSIVVTTRSAKVGTIMGTTSSHHLKKFPNDQCWSLFKETANANRLVMNSELETIREELVTKIGGLPLVAKVLGGAVAFEGDYERWVTKIKSVVKNISTDDNDFLLSTLKLSVDSLPFPSLKQCFAYCSNFPKGYLFDKESLIQMWVAQGFVQAEEGKNKMMMEDVGERYLNFLLSRSLFEVDNDMSVRITHLTMHDLMHDIACVISNHQQKTHSSLHNSCGKTVKKLHTLICNNEESHEKIEDYVFLRVLKVSSIYVGYVFKEIGMLKHLRYLDITNCTESNDLECITKFYNLQTLKLGAITPLPKNLRKLIMLRHLHFNYIASRKMSPLMSQLIHLQTLSAFKVSCEKGRKIEELGPLRNLKGSLRLLNLEEVKSKEEAAGAMLMEKKSLIELGFYWNFSLEDDDNYNGFEVLEGLQPHHNLQSLSVTYYPGKSFPNSIFVEKLVKICLVECGKCEILPMLGQLPKLQELDICYMNSLRSIGREFHGDKASFPKLKEFSLRFMENLEEWEDMSNGIAAFPHLQVLSLIACSKLRSVPRHFLSLQTLIVERCKELTKLPNQLECCNSIKFLMIFDCPKLPGRHMFI